MTECQGCGAWNEHRRTLCVLCGNPLAETDEWDAAAELPPLPPLPDGGLSASMPAWLRDTPSRREPSPTVLPSMEEEVPASASTMAGSSDAEADTATVANAGQPVHDDEPLAEPSLGPEADPRTFLRDEDFPQWIRELPTLPPRPVLPVPPIAAAPAPKPVTLTEPPASGTPVPVPQAEPLTAAQEPSQPDLSMAAVAATPSLQGITSSPAPPESPVARRRAPWETLLLVVLGVAVVATVIWALLVNGLIAIGL